MLAGEDLQTPPGLADMQLAECPLPPLRLAFPTSLCFSLWASLRRLHRSGPPTGPPCASSAVGRPHQQTHLTGTSSMASQRSPASLCVAGPARCYRQIKGKPYPKSRFCRCVLGGRSSNEFVLDVFDQRCGLPAGKDTAWCRLWTTTESAVPASHATSSLFVPLSLQRCA